MDALAAGGLPWYSEARGGGKKDQTLRRTSAKRTT
jgi:hypothetical protein